MKLEDIRGTIKIDLPSFKDQSIEVYDDLLVKDTKELDAINKKENNPFDSGIEMLLRLAKSWTFDDELTKENIEMLPNKDLQIVMKEVAKIIKPDDKKKD